MKSKGQEAVVERVDIKKSLFGKVARVIKPDAIVVTGCDHDDVRAAELGERQ